MYKDHISLVPRVGSLYLLYKFHCILFFPGSWPLSAWQFTIQDGGGLCCSYLFIVQVTDDRTGATCCDKVCWVLGRAIWYWWRHGAILLKKILCPLVILSVEKTVVAIMVFCELKSISRLKIFPEASPCWYKAEKHAQLFTSHLILLIS